MGRKCNVLDCPSDSKRPEDNGVTFHKMPLSQDLRSKWIQLCRVPGDRRINKVIYVCSRHFRRTDFCNFKGTKYILKQGALPSVFPWTKTIPKASTTVTTPTTTASDEQTNNVEVKNECNTPEHTDDSNSNSNKDSIKIETIEVKQEECPEFIESKTTTANVEIIKSDPEAQIKNESTETINFLPGTRIEATDFNDKWFSATILEVDYDENEVFVEFEKNLNKASEWIPMDSRRLRPYQQSIDNQKDSFVIGEKVMATWIKTSNKFPATITKILDDDMYEVLFEDGITKSLKSHKLLKIKNIPSHVKEPIRHTSPLFDPVASSKEERRQRKRKLNVAALFGKHTKKSKLDDHIKSDPEDELPPQEESSISGATKNSDGEEWTCRWINGEPVGIEAILSGNDGPRRSVIVADHRLPPGWEKHLVQRMNGSYAGKWDTILLNSEGKKFLTKNAVKVWLEETKAPYHIDQFDFCLHINRAKKLGLYEVNTLDSVTNKTTPNNKLSKSVRGTPKTPSNKSSTSKITNIGMSSPITNDLKTEVEEEDTSGCLKIIHENDSYKCPIEGCGKNFRKENLAQMHIKHYHPEFTKLLGSTPNVADLAYARTVGESIDEIIPRRSIHSPLEKPKYETPTKSKSIKILAQRNYLKTEDVDTKSEKILSTPILSKPVKDAEIIRLLSTEPKTINSVIDSLSSEITTSSDNLSRQPVGPDKYPDIKLKDLLHKAEPIPIKKEEQRTGIKTLLPVIRQPETNSESDDSEIQQSTRKRQISENSEGSKRKKPNEITDFPENDSYFSDSIDKIPTDPVPASTPDPMNPIVPATPPGVIIEGGELNDFSEEIINCTCGITEEDGLMIQCEICLCWQHAYCNNIQKENEVPEKYICYICLHPYKVRSAKKFIYDQDWIKKGVLPIISGCNRDEVVVNERFEKLKQCHQLSGCLHELNEYIHWLKLKLYIAEHKDHPKLYLWNKEWDKPNVKNSLNLSDTDTADEEENIAARNVEVVKESEVLSKSIMIEENIKVEGSLDVEKENLMKTSEEEAVIFVKEEKIDTVVSKSKKTELEVKKLNIGQSKEDAENKSVNQKIQKSDIASEKSMKNNVKEKGEKDSSESVEIVKDYSDEEVEAREESEHVSEVLDDDKGDESDEVEEVSDEDTDDEFGDDFDGTSSEDYEEDIEEEELQDEAEEESDEDMETELKKTIKQRSRNNVEREENIENTSQDDESEEYEDEEKVEGEFGDEVEKEELYEEAEEKEIDEEVEDEEIDEEEEIEDEEIDGVGNEEINEEIENEEIDEEVENEEINEEIENEEINEEVENEEIDEDAENEEIDEEAENEEIDQEAENEEIDEEAENEEIDEEAENEEIDEEAENEEIHEEVEEDGIEDLSEEKEFDKVVEKGIINENEEKDISIKTKEETAEEVQEDEIKQKITDDETVKRKFNGEILERKNDKESIEKVLYRKTDEEATKKRIDNKSDEDVLGRETDVETVERKTVEKNIENETNEEEIESEINKKTEELKNTFKKESMDENINVTKNFEKELRKEIDVKEEDNMDRETNSKNESILNQLKEVQDKNDLKEEKDRDNQQKLGNVKQKEVQEEEKIKIKNVKENHNEKEKYDSMSDIEHSYTKSTVFGDMTLNTVLQPHIIESSNVKKELFNKKIVKSENELISLLEDNNIDMKDITKDNLSTPTEFPKIDLNTMIQNEINLENSKQQAVLRNEQIKEIKLNDNIGFGENSSVTETELSEKQINKDESTDGLFVEFSSDSDLLKSNFKGQLSEEFIEHLQGVVLGDDKIMEAEFNDSILEEELNDVNKDNDLSTIPSGLLSSGSLELNLTQTDLDRLTELVQFEELDKVANMDIVPFNIPQPEAVIDLQVCQQNLMDHVAHYQKLVDERLDNVEAAIIELEELDSLSPKDIEDTIIKKGMTMILRDLKTLSDLSIIIKSYHNAE